MCRVEPGDPVFGYNFGDTDLRGDGIRGSHGGSAMSALGGSIRLGELTRGEPIRHAIDLLLELLSAPDSEPRHVLLAPPVSLRASAGPAPTSDH